MRNGSPHGGSCSPRKRNSPDCATGSVSSAAICLGSGWTRIMFSKDPVAGKPCRSCSTAGISWPSITSCSPRIGRKGAKVAPSGPTISMASTHTCGSAMSVFWPSPVRRCPRSRRSRNAWDGHSNGSPRSATTSTTTTVCRSGRNNRRQAKPFIIMRRQDGDGGTARYQRVL